MQERRIVWANLFAKILLGLSVLGAIASILALEGLRMYIFLGLCTVFFVGGASFGIGHYLGRRSAQPTTRQYDSALQSLGVTHVYETAAADSAFFSSHVAGARRIRMLVVTAEMVLRNLPAPFKDALGNGAQIEVLVGREDSDLVAEMDQMEIADGRQPGRTIKECLRQIEPELVSLLRDASQDIPPRQQDRLGTICLGRFNTQYRESMIICDDNWVWWTPHFNPVRGFDRPTFVAEGAESKFVKLSIRHFEGVKGMCVMKELSLQQDVYDSSPSVSPEGATHAKGEEVQQLLLENAFRLYFTPPHRSKVVTFGKSGEVIEGRNKHEHNWRIRANGFCFLSSEGAIFSRFIYEEKQRHFVNARDAKTECAKEQHMEILEELERKLRILEASYGTDADHTFTATHALNRLVEGNRLRTVASNKRVGDPHYGEAKRLWVRYRYGSKVMERTFPEGEAVELP